MILCLLDYIHVIINLFKYNLVSMIICVLDDNVVSIDSDDLLV